MKPSVGAAHKGELLFLIFKQEELPVNTVEVWVSYDSLGLLKEAASFLNYITRSIEHKRIFTLKVDEDLFVGGEVHFVLHMGTLLSHKVNIGSTW